MCKRQKCIWTLFCSVILLTAYDVSDAQDIKTTTQEESEELTEPILDLNALLDIDGQYGLYSTQSFEYYNWQQFHFDEPYFVSIFYHNALMDVRCSADHVRCLSNLEIPAPICGYFYLQQYVYHRYKVFESYCHVFLENCLLRHRRYRMLNYGGCLLSETGNPTKWEYPPEDKIH